MYNIGGAKERLAHITRKDTTITADIFLTTRTKLNIRLEGFLPTQSGDEFSVITSCGAGLERRNTSGGFMQANQPITEGTIDACGNEQTTVIMRKRKNGVSTSTTSTIDTPVGQTVSLTFTF